MTDRDAPERILLRAPNWVGDVIMATPALRALRQAHPAAELWVEARPFLRELLEPLPTVDRFLPDPGRGLAALRRRVRALRAGRFDWAVLLPDSLRSALGPFLARVPRRVGSARDPLRRALLTEALPPPTEGGRRVPISMIERYLRVTRALGCPDAGRELEVPVTDAAREAAGAALEQAGVGAGEPLLLVVPGASYGSSKLWPAAHFSAACDAIAREHGLHTVLVPGPGEETVAHAVAVGMRAPAAVLTLSLGGVAAVCERARLALTNDTGPRQIAVAQGVPAVVLMGPTDPRHTEHNLERQRVLREAVDCSPYEYPCGLKRCPIDHRCMTRLGPERAVDAARELLTSAAAR